MTKSRQWATLTAVACLAVLAAGWLLVIKPQRTHASSLRTQAQSVQADAARLRTSVQQLRQQQKDLPAVQQELSRIATKIPDNPALPALIRQLSAAADGAGVNLVSLAPGQPAVVAAPVSAAPAAATKTTSSSTAVHVHHAVTAPLANIPLTVQVQGTYFNVEQFFSAVESLNRAMLVSGFSLTPAVGGGAGATAGAAELPPGTLNAQITAQVFESPQLAPATTVPATSTTGH